MRGAVHPPTAWVCWQVRGPLTAPMAAVLRHHPGGARRAAPGGLVGDPGAAAATRLRLSSTAQPDIRLHSVGGRRLSGAAREAALDGCQARQLRGGKQELAPSAMVVRRGRIDG